MQEEYKFINSGAYGCVVRPNIPCLDKDLVSKKMISKLFIPRSSSSAYRDEIELNNIVKNIDPSSKFTVKMMEYCKIKNEKIPTNIPRHCSTDKYGNKPEEINQIIYEYGGLDLYKMIRADNRPTFFEIFKAFKNVFEGLVVLKKKKIVHYDIKPENMVFLTEGVKTPVIKLIDFGLSQSMNDVYSPNFELNYIHRYAYYPPEFLAFSNANLNTDVDLNQNYNLLFRNFNKLNHRLQKIKDEKILQKFRKLFDYLFRNDFKYRIDASQIDVFSLGASIIDLLIEYDPNIEENWKFYFLVLKLSFLMIDRDAKVRLSPEKALANYKYILKQTDKHYSTPTFSSTSRKIKSINSGKLKKSV